MKRLIVKFIKKPYFLATIYSLPTEIAVHEDTQGGLLLTKEHNPHLNWITGYIHGTLLTDDEYIKVM